MLQEGFFVDSQASTLEVKVLVYNGDEQLFGYAGFEFSFRSTGPLVIEPFFNTFKLPVRHYQLPMVYPL
jgi:hypothetical protein